MAPLDNPPSLQRTAIIAGSKAEKVAFEREGLAVRREELAEKKARREADEAREAARREYLAKAATTGTIANREEILTVVSAELHTAYLPGDRLTAAQILLTAQGFIEKPVASKGTLDELAKRYAALPDAPPVVQTSEHEHDDPIAAHIATEGEPAP